MNSRSTTTGKQADTLVKAPTHRSADSKAFFEYVIAEYQGVDKDHVKLLTISLALHQSAGTASLATSDLNAAFSEDDAGGSSRRQGFGLGAGIGYKAL